MKLAVRSTGAHPWLRAHILLAVAATVFATKALPRAGGVSCELGPSLGVAVLGRLPGLRQTARTRLQGSSRPRHGPDRYPRDRHCRSGGGAPRARRHGRTRRGRHGLPYTCSRSSSPAVTPCRRCSIATIATITLDVALAIW